MNREDLFAVAARPVRLEDTTDQRKSRFPFAACKRQTSGLYAPGLYMGAQRPPQPARADERGAAAVIDLAFGGRVALHFIASDRDWMRVESLP